MMLTLGGEFAGSQKLGLAPKVLQNLWGSVGGFFSKVFYCAQDSAQPSCTGGAEMTRILYDNNSRILTAP